MADNQEIANKQSMFMQTTLATEQALESRYVMATYARKAVEFVRGQGLRLYDDADREYLDFLAGIGVVSVGHADPAVNAALTGQAAKLLHVSNNYYIEGRGELAATLSALLNGDLAVAAQAGAAVALDETVALDAATALTTTATPGIAVATAPAAGVAAAPADSQPAAATGSDWQTFFANSGAEAIEGTLKLARRYGQKHLQGATGIVSAQRSFHGRTFGALSATGQAKLQTNFQPLLPGFCHVELNDIAALEAALDSPTAVGPVAALLLEPIQGEGGVWPCTPEYLRAARELTAERGQLLILDEVQTGFFRTGTAFAFQSYGVVPDVVAMAKGIANGMPMGAFAAPSVIASCLEVGDHGTTFGGSALAVAAARATIARLLAMQAGPNAQAVGNYLRARLVGLPGVTEVRGQGLMVGLTLDQAVANAVVDTAIARAANGLTGLIFNAPGPDMLRFLPPLCCSMADVDQLIDGLAECLTSCRAA